MKRLFIPIFCSTLSFAALNDIYSFKADFTQNVTDDKNTTLRYEGSVQAKKPQDALWSYSKPIRKDVFIDRFKVAIVEPELEQVIIKKIESTFDFFKMISNAKKINESTYEAHYKDSKFLIKTDANSIQSIAYKDEFENDVVIAFKNQKQNIEIDESVFIAEYPPHYDVIGD